MRTPRLPPVLDRRGVRRSRRRSAMSCQTSRSLVVAPCAHEVGEREVGLVPERAHELTAHLVVAPRGLAMPPPPDHHRDEVALRVEVERLEVREALERA